MLVASLTVAAPASAGCYSRSVPGVKCATPIDEKCKPKKVSVCDRLKEIFPNSNIQVEICDSPKTASKKEILKTNQTCEFAGDMNSCCKEETKHDNCYRLTKYDCDTIVKTSNVGCMPSDPGLGTYNETICQQNQTGTPTEEGDYVITNTACP